MKNATLTKDIQIFTHKLSVLPGICWCECNYMIQYSIYDSFSGFLLNFSLEIENI